MAGEDRPMYLLLLLFVCVCVCVVELVGLGQRIWLIGSS